MVSRFWMGRMTHWSLRTLITRPQATSATFTGSCSQTLTGRNRSSRRTISSRARQAACSRTWQEGTLSRKRPEGLNWQQPAVGRSLPAECCLLRQGRGRRLSSGCLFRKAGPGDSSSSCQAERRSPPGAEDCRFKRKGFGVRCPGSVEICPGLGTQLAHKGLAGKGT